MRKILFVLLSVCFFSSACAQGFAYRDKTDLGNGLYKVKSGDCYGIIDKNDNVIVSIEFQNILFHEGKALLTKNDFIYGIVDTLGTIKMFDAAYKVHPKYRYIYDGYIIVGEDKWGYIDENGNPLRLKTKGFFSLGKKFPTQFDDVAPFVEDFAAVYTHKDGWKHIDKEGTEHYRLRDKKNEASFRSSVYKGECIIVTNDGIKQCQESDDGAFAVVKRVLSPAASFIETIQIGNSSKLIYKEGVLYLDSLMRVTKYENGTDSIIFIQQQPPQKGIVRKMIVPIDTTSISHDLMVELTDRNIRANEKGQAYTKIKVKNKGNFKYKNVFISIKSSNASREWKGDIGANSDLSLSFNIPARFSSLAIKRNIVVNIAYDKERIEKDFTVTIKRYTPIRSR